jgi:hypothetical protein
LRVRQATKFLTRQFRRSYIPSVEWVVEYTDGFEGWWNSLSEAEQEDVNAKVILLQRYGPALRRPHSDVIASSRHSHMKELIIRHAGGGRTAWSTPLTRGVLPFCSWEAARLVTIGGTRSSFR